MFPNNKSSSYEISSKANDCVQNFKGNEVEVHSGAGQLPVPAPNTCISNDSMSVVQEQPTHISSSFPTYHVPDMRDTVEGTYDWPGVVGSQASSMSSTSPPASSITSTAAQSTNNSTMQEALPSAAPTHCASLVATRSRSIVKTLHTGCDPCGCCNHHPNDNCASCWKSEAFCHVCCKAHGEACSITTPSSSEGSEGRHPVEAAPVSVISSSSGKVVATEVELFPPSPHTVTGVRQGSIAVFASDLGSSSGSMLHQQQHAPSQACGRASECTTISAENSHESEQVHQYQNLPAGDSEIGRQSPGPFVPAWEEKLTTGALSDQDNNRNVKAKHSNNSVKEHSHLGGGNAKHSNNARSQTPLNIPEAGREPRAIQATVQGNNDSSNPPASFNNSVNVSDKSTVCALETNASILNDDYDNSYLPSNDDQEAELASKNLNTSPVISLRTEPSDIKLRQPVDGKLIVPCEIKYKVMMMMKRRYHDGPASNLRWGIPPGLGLLGGGESSLNNGTTGWGTPPSSNNNSNNNANNSNNNPGANSAAAAGWGNANSTNNPGNNPGGQAQWGAPNNNRPNAGNNQNSGTQQNAGGNGGPQNKGANPMASGQVMAQTNTPGQQAPSQQPGPQSQSNQPSNQPGQQAPQPGQPPQGQPGGQPQQPPTSQPPPQNGSSSWAQAPGELGTNQPPPSGGPLGSNNGGPPGGNGGQGGLSAAGGSGAPPAPSSKQQLEQLNTMREALFSQDGWGGQNVNQDTGWDIPSSPEPVAKDNNGGPPVWKPNVNNGTDLWEANLRNGGQPPPQTQQKTPWGHTPTTNIGGTWGEDDDVADSSNMWTGVPSNPGPGVGPGGPQWNNPGPGGPGGPGPGPGPGPAGGMWGGPKKDDWSRGSSNWGEPRGDPRSGDPRMGMDAMGGDPRELRGVGGGMDPRDMRGAGNDPRDMRSGVDMRGDQMRGPMDPMRGDGGMRDPRDIRGMDMRGDMMRGGVSGRLNGVMNDLLGWGQPPQPPHHNMPHHQPSQPPRGVGPGVASGGGNFPGGVNQWAGPPPKDMGMPGAGSKPSGWEEPSPPAQRRNIPNYDDGTSLWGQQQNRMGGGKVSHWKEMPTPMPGRGIQCPPGMPQNRMPSSNAGNMKPDGPLWSHPGRNGSWDGPHDGAGGGPWGDEPKGGMSGMNNWTEPPLTPSSWGGPKPKNPMNPGGWVEGDMDASWGQPPKPGPKLTKDMIWISKQFRMLTEMGYKKEDVENALRVSNMNLENALEMLNATRMNMDAWRSSGHDEHSVDIGGSHSAGSSGSGFSARGFPHNAPPIPFAPPGGPGMSNQPSLITMNNANPSLTNISPALVQKMLMQQPPPQQPPSQQAASFNQSQRNSQSQPSTQQLQMLVKQIQMAVGAGYLNQQILNQPLSPQTLILLNQLLQQIKVLQQLSQQQQTVASVQKGNPAMLHISVQLTKTKQQISNLQNQIQAQQAMYVKQHHVPTQGPPQDYFKPSNMQDPMAAIPNFGELSIKEPPVVGEQSFQSQQSRLNQWKLPSLDKDPDGLGNEFSRAPGTTSKTPGLAQSHSSPNINPILSQGDGPWASVSRSNSDTGWPDSANVEGGQPDKDWPITSQSNSFTDLVPEFEPGKPWKGNQLKSIEDDPSITPGSVVRSPLSLAAIKDSEIFSTGGVSKTSPTSSGVDMALTPLSLSSSTWSYNTASSTASSFTSPLGKLGGSKGPWGDGALPTAVTSELWGTPMNKPRGPPPGLSNKNPNGNPGGNGSGGANAGGSAGQGGGAGAGSGNSSSNGWGRGAGAGSSWGMQGGAGATAGAGTSGTAGWGSTWLLLKNLTPQIDGSTLKTLCLQHGPLQNFHLYLNHGIALVKYQSREEANKAQAALNNCVLSNTTIFAESPSDSEVHNLLSHLGGHGATQQQQQQGGAAAPNWGMRTASGGANSGAPPAPSKVAPPSSQDMWSSGGGGSSSQLWASTPSSSALWGSSPMDSSGDQHRATPSSFLPGDLLGGESM